LHLWLGRYAAEFLAKGYLRRYRQGAGVTGKELCRSMQDKLVQGLYAALLTPRRPDDSVDEPALTRLLEFLRERGVRAYAINGATGEFCLTAPQELRAILGVVHKVVPDAKILCGIGAARIARTLELASIATGEGADAFLLPMSYFFPYEQQDLESFVEAVACRAKLPIMLYNLPDFTTELLPETSCRLIRELPNVIGIKDSGASLATLRRLTEEQIPSCRIVGNDGILTDALRERVCDGVVSGVACVLPELTGALFAEPTESERFAQLDALLTDFRNRLGRFPVPWGLKWIAEARGICTATFAQPISELRRRQSQEFISWYREWEVTSLAITAQPSAAAAKT
jgi:4-hydroxy-tetrahydrodipicolinate synthase